MSFESGSVSFRMFYVPRAFPRDAVEKFAAHAAPPIDTLGDGEINGWVSGRHLLDRKITEDNAYYGGFLRLTLMKAEKKIPDSLLRAECKIEELAQLAASGKDHLSQATRGEIRRSVEARLLPQMPPTLKGIPFVYDEKAELLHAAALSDKQLDVFQIFLTQTVGFGLIPVLPETASLKRKQANVKDWRPTSFSPEMEDDEVPESPGRDFLTWLWFVAEARGGMIKAGELGDFAVMIEGPLLFVMEGAGAHETSLRKGEPMLSAEAKTALLSGKKLRRAKITLARNDQSWTCSFDADQFVFRGLKLPEGEKLDAVSRFQERMALLDTFQQAFMGLFDRFVDERRDAKIWKDARADIHKWVSGRKTRR
jgi:hypothetical protein